MYSLRKRAKLIESEEILGDQCSLSSLPNELKLIIFDYLPVKDLLKLRCVNKNFKNLVDNYTRVWRNVRIKVKFGESQINKTPTKTRKPSIESDLSTFRKFISTVESRETIVINCDKHFGHKLVKSGEKDLTQISPPRKRARLHSMCLVNLTRDSVIPYLELISNYCHKLKIDWFYFGHVTLKPIERLVVLNHVYCLDISDANPIIHYVDEIFPNLKHLHIRIGSTSVLTLQTIFSNLTNIRLIEMKSFNGLESMFSAPSFQPLDRPNNKLKVKTLIFNYLNLRCIELLLSNIFDANGLENLELELNWSDPDCDTSSFLSFLLDYLNTSSSQLECLRINIFERNYEPSALEIDLLCKLFSRARRTYLPIISSALASSALHCDMEVRFQERDKNKLSCYIFPNQFEEISSLASSEQQPNNSEQIDEYRKRVVKNLVKLRSYWRSGETSVYF